MKQRVSILIILVGIFSCTHDAFVKRKYTKGRFREKHSSRQFVKINKNKKEEVVIQEEIIEIEPNQGEEHILSFDQHEVAKNSLNKRKVVIPDMDEIQVEEDYVRKKSDGSEEADASGLFALVSLGLVVVIIALILIIVFTTPHGTALGFLAGILYIGALLSSAAAAIIGVVSLIKGKHKRAIIGLIIGLILFLALLIVLIVII